VRGEKRYWPHVAIDRFTGEIIDQQIEAVRHGESVLWRISYLMLRVLSVIGYRTLRARYRLSVIY
jgi:hypothetical protein